VRIIEPMRSDSLQVAVALHHGRFPADANDPARLLALERVLLRLRPDVLFPAIGDPVPSVLPSTTPSMPWWRLLIRSADEVRRRVRPATKIGIALSRMDARDSALYAWARTSGSRADLVGAVVYPSFSGLPGVDARLRAFDRWHARASDSTRRPPAHWLLEVGGFPHAHGDAAQLSAIRHALAWGSRRSWVSAAIIGETGDYRAQTGVRAANGRVRLAWPTLSAAARGMREARTGTR
jgi:hypothetical protein